MSRLSPSHDTDHSNADSGHLMHPSAARNPALDVCALSNDVSKDASRNDGGPLLHRMVVSFFFLTAFIILNHPFVILLSRLGTVVWYPAAGLSLALLLGVSPSYAILVALGAALAGRIFYDQPYLSYGETIGAAGMAIAYGYAAYLLRDVLRIDLGLRRRLDVLHYLAVTTGACVLSTTIGVACLAADHSIPWRSFPKAGLVWFLGDEITLIGVSPFLLIHVFPWIRKQLSSRLESTEEFRGYPWTIWGGVEFIAQMALLLFSLWIAISPRFRQMNLLYIGSVPVTWIAIRQGIRRVVSGLLVLNFGVVLAAHLFPPDPGMLTQFRLFMFVLSALGLVVGSAITERHRTAGELLVAKHKAEEASRIKSEFLANMSHEIRTPLNGVLGMAELVLDSNPTEEQREYLEILKSSGDLVQGVINDVLDFSRTESGNLRIEEFEFDLQDLVRDTLKTLSLRARENRLELAYYIDPRIPARLVGDPGRLRQILLNLTGNAIKFTPAGEVVLEVRLGTRDDPKVIVEFAVKDTGIGIAAEKQELIFEPFVQADSSTTRAYGGAGLGLSICSRLVRLMNGRLWLESAEGKGSTFYFALPLKSCQKDANSIIENHPELLSVPVLVVDDNAEVRRILSEITSAWGMRAVSVDNAPAALQALHQAHADGRPIKLAILEDDVHEANGIDLASQIRLDPHLSDLPIIVTAYPGKRKSSEFYRSLGIVARLLKPVGTKELLHATLRGLGKEANLFDATGEECAPVAPIPPLRILLAEDNPINQVVAADLIARLGHIAVVAGNGAEALALLESDKFDLVLMDVQMPVKDGLTTTREIREQERGTDTHIPIVAMTAHALKGDKERCLAAGMDIYLSKPINSARLKDAIAAAYSRITQPRLPFVQPSGAAETWDVTTARRNVGDEALLKEILHIFVEETPKQLAALESAIASGDAATIERVAHTLKGELGCLGMVDALSLARNLERIGREHSLSAAPEVFHDLRARLLAAVSSVQ